LLRQIATESKSTGKRRAAAALPAQLESFRGSGMEVRNPDYFTESRIILTIA